MRDNDKTSSSRLGNLIADFFVERQIIIRAHGRVSYLKFSPALQKGLIIGALALICWTGLSTTGWINQRGTLSAQRASLVETQRSYDQLVGQIAAYEETSGKLAADLEAKQKLLSILSGDNARLRAGLKESETEKRRAEEMVKRLEAGRVALHQHVESLEDQLADAGRVNDELRLSLKAARSDEMAENAEPSEPTTAMAEAAPERERAVEAAMQQTAELEERLAMLRDRLHSVDGERRELSQNNIALKEKLSRMDQRHASAVETLRSEMRRRIAALRKEHAVELGQVRNENAEQVKAASDRLAAELAKVISRAGAEGMASDILAADGSGIGGVGISQKSRQDLAQALRRAFEVQAMSSNVAHEATVAALRAEHHRQLAALDRNFQRQYAELQTTWQDRVAEISDEAALAVSSRNQAAEINRRQIVALHQDKHETAVRIRNLLDDHATALDDMQTAAEQERLEALAANDRRWSRHLSSLQEESRRRIEDLKGRLAQLETDNSAVIAELKGEIEGMTSRHGLEISSLQSELEQKLAAADLQRQREVAEMERLMADRLEKVEASLNGQIAFVRAEKAAMENQHREILVEMAEHTIHSTRHIEHLIARTGLDPASFAAPIETEFGTGGPFVAFDGEVLEQLSVAEVAVLVERNLERWDKLRQVVRTLPVTRPVDGGELTSTFGRRRDPFNGRWAMHSGIDFSGKRRTPVRAAAAGTIAFTGWKGGYGRTVEVDHGFGLVTRYAHLHSINVEEGDKVEVRDVIGRLGSTGRSTGPHLHYEVHFNGQKYDPLKFLKAGKNVLEE